MMLLLKVMMVAIASFCIQKLLIKCLNKSTYVVNNSLFLNDKAITIAAFLSSIVLVVYLLKIDNIFNLILFSAATIIMIAAATVDYYHKEIPPALNLMLLVLGVLNIIANYNMALQYILSGVIPGALFLIIALVSNGGIGGGDIKLIVPLGFILGPELIFFAIVRSYWIGLLILFPLIISKRRKLKDLVAYGPFITIATIFSIVADTYFKVGRFFI